MATGYKTCSTCVVLLPLSSFSKKKSSKDGLNSRCRTCASHANKCWRELNPEKVVANNKRWYVENYEEKLAYNRGWRRANPESARASCRKWQRGHLGTNRQSSRRWRINNPEKAAMASLRSKNKWKEQDPEGFAACFAASKQRRRARREAVGVVDLTRKEWHFLRSLYGFACAYCGEAHKRLTQDHVLSILNKGNHTLANILPACQSCNSKKGADKFIIPHLLRCADSIARPVQAFLVSTDGALACPKTF